MTWPSEKELWLAKTMGHEPMGYQRCTCGWPEDGPQPPGIPMRVHLANHIWTTIRNASEDLLPALDERANALPEPEATKIAALRGHEPRTTYNYRDCCFGCAWSQWSTGQHWAEHARRIAAEALNELESFDPRE